MSELHAVEDRHGNWLVVDAHGDIYNAFDTPIAANEWIADWKQTLEKQREIVRKQDDERRLFTNEFMHRPGVTLDDADDAYYAFQREQKTKGV